MRAARSLPCLLVLACGPAFATGQAAAPATAKNAKVIAQDQAQVVQLQKQVAQQESASQQAAARLQQQDDTIARLRAQLKAAQAGNTPSAATAPGQH